MTWRDKMEIGLKHDAPFRRDNLPAFEAEGPGVPAGPGRSPVVPKAAAAGMAEETRTARRKKPVSKPPARRQSSGRPAGTTPRRRR